MDLLGTMPPKPGDQCPAAYETAFLTVEGDVAHFFPGTDRIGQRR